jgi:hypothetical protein
VDRALARQAVVVVRNADGVLPLAAGRRVALVGPVADDPKAMLGTYSFPAHVGAHYPDREMGIEVPSLRASLGELIPGLAYAPGCAITGEDTSGTATRCRRWIPHRHFPVAQTTRPVARLIGYQRVPLEPDEAARVTFTVPADLTSFIGVDDRRIVEPGDVELWFGRSSGDIAATVPVRLTGAIRGVGAARRLAPEVRVDRLP